MKNNQNGFTLVELIVVIAIIGILATVMMPKFMGFTDKAKEKAVLTEATAINSACESIQVETGVYPSDVKEVWKQLGKDYSSADNGGATLTLDANAETFTYEKTVKGKKFEVKLEKTKDANGIVTKEKLTVTPK